MLSARVAIIAAASLLPWQPAYGRSAEPGATFSVSITIIPKCVTEVDKTSLKVSERCNGRYPHRISTVSVPPRISVGNDKRAGAGSTIPQPLYGDRCSPQSGCLITVIYY